MRKTASLLCVVLMLCMFGSANVKAQDKGPGKKPTEDKKPPKVDVTGTWNVEIEVAGQTGSPVFTLKQEGAKITGKYVGSFGEQNVIGKVTGDKVEWKFTIDQGDIVYVGTVDRDSIKGTAKYGDFDGTWTAKRSIDVTGTWHVEVEVAGQTGSPVFTLKQKGDMITGKYNGSFGEQDVTGTVKGTTIEFGFTLDEGKVVYAGTIDKDAMKGEAKYGDLSGTWTAKREKKVQQQEKRDAKTSKEGVKNGSVQKETFEYAVKDSQKLHLDRIVDTSVNVAGKRPVMIFSVGGGWESGGRDDKGLQPFLNRFASLGHTVVSIDYRLGIKAAKAKGEMTKENGTAMYLRAIQWGVEDLFDATSFVLKHADEWNIDKDQIVILGGSAGATNSLVAEFNVANDTELARAHLPQGFRYAGVISMAGAFWLQANTPLAFKSKPAPILFFHGAKDQLVTYDEHQGAFSGYGPAYYCRTFHGPEYPKWFVDYPEGDHIVAATPTIDGWHEMEAFLQKLVKERQQISVHTVEEAKTPKTIGNFLKRQRDRSLAETATDGKK